MVFLGKFQQFFFLFSMVFLGIHVFTGGSHHIRRGLRCRPQPGCRNELRSSLAFGLALFGGSAQNGGGAGGEWPVMPVLRCCCCLMVASISSTCSICSVLTCGSWQRSSCREWFYHATRPRLNLPAQRNDSDSMMQISHLCLRGRHSNVG